MYRTTAEGMQEGGGISETSDRAYTFSEGMGSATPFSKTGPRVILKGRNHKPWCAQWRRAGRRRKAALFYARHDQKLRELSGCYVVSVPAGARVLQRQSRDAPPQPP